MAWHTMPCSRASARLVKCTISHLFNGRPVVGPYDFCGKGRLDQSEVQDDQASCICHIYFG